MMTTFGIALLVLALAIFIDLILGEPPLWLHPTVLMGKVISAGVRVAPGGGSRLQRAYGVVLALGTIAIFAGSSYLILLAAQVIGEPVQILLGALLLKPTFSIRLMRDYASELAAAVQRGDWAQAKDVLRHMVRRDPDRLTESQMTSAGVESVAESSTDGITSPFFYYALFGVPGAFAFRAINTLDSMVGYKTPEFIDLGWFSAKLDSVANWLPARLTSVLTVISAALIGASASNSWRILLRDRNRTESWNAGWLMSATAGALRVKLEKPGFYVLGDEDETLSHQHLTSAIRIMVLDTVLFVVLVVLPIVMAVRMLATILG